MNRSKVREETFKLLYSLQLMDDVDLEEQIDLFISENEITDNDAVDYIKNVINGVKKNEDEIVKQIEENIKKDWTISRISKIDLALLKLGIFEILYSKIPYKVVVNEVVELAKKYGDDSSKGFVNGVLASVIKKNGIATEATSEEE